MTEASDEESFAFWIGPPWSMMPREIMLVSVVLATALGHDEALDYTVCADN